MIMYSKSLDNKKVEEHKNIFHDSLPCTNYQNAQFFR